MDLRTILILIAFCLPENAIAEEMVPLRKLIGMGAENSYPLVRCGGLYLSGLTWAGEDAFGLEATDSIKKTIAYIVGFATDLRTPALGSDAHQSVLRDVKNMSDAYLKRYESNYTTSGQAWGGDALWASDTETCSLLVGGGQ